MADDAAILDQVNVITADLQRSLEFYRRLGAVFPRPLRNATGRLFHASCDPHGGALLELDTAEFAPVWNAGWAGRGDLLGRVVLGFRIPTREGVDQRFSILTSAGYRGLQLPFDAFWGARYAIVEDPDGIAIGLMSPIDPTRRTAPPKDGSANSVGRQRHDANPRRDPGRRAVGVLQPGSGRGQGGRAG